MFNDLGKIPAKTPQKGSYPTIPPPPPLPPSLVRLRANVKK